MKKTELMEKYEAVKDDADCIILWIHMPGGETEIISNPSVAEKIAYIDKTYDDDLVHANCKDIYIEDAYIYPKGDGPYDFGTIIGFLKEGEKVARKGWNGKSQYIQLATGISYKSATGEIINCEHDSIGNKAIAFVGTSGVQMGWLASQADMLAEDWVVVE